MSPIATTLSRRGFRARPVGQVSHPAHASASAVRTLGDLRRGDRARISGYGAADPQITRRLFDLGLCVGAEVEVVRVAPMQDPVIFRVADYELALRRREARGILVDPT